MTDKKVNIYSAVAIIFFIVLAVFAATGCDESPPTEPKRTIIVLKPNTFVEKLEVLMDIGFIKQDRRLYWHLLCVAYQKSPPTRKNMVDFLKKALRLDGYRCGEKDYVRTWENHSKGNNRTVYELRDSSSIWTVRNNSSAIDSDWTINTSPILLAKEALLTAKDETGYSTVGIGKPPKNNAVGKKYSFNHFNWSEGRVSRNDQQFKHWTYSLLNYVEYRLNPKNKLWLDSQRNADSYISDKEFMEAK